MHSHLCSECSAIVTFGDDLSCLTSNDHEDGLCEACAQAQEGSDEIA
jgi:hypothetical protein